MNRQPTEEGRPSPAKYSTPAIAADTTKDFLAEVVRACPAMRVYLERLALADEIVRRQRLDLTLRYDGRLADKWYDLWLQT